jgi:hypothetical protein
LGGEVKMAFFALLRTIGSYQGEDRSGAKARQNQALQNVL